MDNASKALIMAGAILIAVALVGVGVYLYSSAAAQVDNASTQLSAAEIQLKNSEFEQFIGSGDVKGTEVVQLVRKINAFNSQDVFPNKITISTNESGSSFPTWTAIHPTTGYTNSKLYTVKCEYDSDGYIRNIVIK